MQYRVVAAVLVGFGLSVCRGDAIPELPIDVGTFQQEEHLRYTMAQGLPGSVVERIAIDDQGSILAETNEGIARFSGDRWEPVEEDAVQLPVLSTLTREQEANLRSVVGGTIAVREVAIRAGEIAVAADSGLYIGDGTDWRLALPREGEIRWAPVDVRAVAYDAEGALWFAAPQGVGRRVSEDEWELFTGHDGLPYNDFTCMAAGPEGVWFGTTNGAIHYHDGYWAFRQGGRWLLDDSVRDIAVDVEGNAWIATAAGVSCIARKPMTLAKKAAFYEEEIEKYHRRTSLGYVCPAELAVPGDKSTGTPVFTDNDGHFNGLYLGAMSLGYKATGDPVLKQHAHGAFRAVAFLSEVTQGGTHPAPEGFFARAVVPTTDPDPNPEFDLDYDIRRNERDALWKIIQPRFPIDETGDWYWKNDSSPDELDGHFFGYGAYYDHVCETDAEKEAVRAVVRRLVDHIIEHDYNLVDYDGKPTRWGHFSPDDLNRNPEWVMERGLNSNSILTYLSVAHHVTGDPKYRDEYLRLAIDEGYGMNGMTQPKDIAGPGTFGQGDDYMAFMNYYHLIRYETDPKLLSMYYFAIRRHWEMEQYERNTFANFVYAACCQGKVRSDQWGDSDLSLDRKYFEDAIDTLKRYPLDLIDWPHSNAHRTDMVPLQSHLWQSPGSAGHRVDGYVFPIDERNAINWGRDPWFLSYGGKGTELRDSIHYLVAYYMGLAHEFIQG